MPPKKKIPQELRSVKIEQDAHELAQIVKLFYEVEMTTFMSEAIREKTRRDHPDAFRLYEAKHQGTLPV